MPSSVIRAMRFDPVRRVLEIVFRGARGAYRYFDVPLDEWRRFREAPSKGEYLNGFFKAKGFRYQKASLALVAGKNQRRDAEKRDQREHDAELLLWGEADALPEPGAQRGEADNREKNDFDDLTRSHRKAPVQVQFDFWKAA